MLITLLKRAYHKHCFIANRKLFEECTINTQCTQKSGKAVCTALHERKLCMCKAGYVEERKSLKCRKGDLCIFPKLTEYKVKIRIWNATSDFLFILANKRINERCLINEQCNGTENANTCLHRENITRCSCNDGFAWIHEKCLKSEDECVLYPKKVCFTNEKLTMCTFVVLYGLIAFPRKFFFLWIIVGRKLFETCSNREQCNGTDNAWNCTDTHVDNNKVCFCQDGYLNFKGQCIKGIISLLLSLYQYYAFL